MNDLQPINLPGLDPRRPLVIAGPCSAETEEQVIETARELAAEGFKLFRAGLWKPRTKPGGFEGVGVEGIAWAATRKTRNRDVYRHGGRYAQACPGSDRRRHRHDLDRGPHDGEPVRHAGDRRCAARARYPGAGEKPRESRPRIVDRRRGTHLQRRHPPPGCHPPRVHVDRQKPLPQPPDVVDPHRAAPPPPGAADILRPEPISAGAAS